MVRMKSLWGPKNLLILTNHFINFVKLLHIKKHTRNIAMGKDSQMPLSGPTPEEV